MNHFKMLFLDIDGTIITPDNTIQDSTKTAVAKTKEIGMETVLATGRPIHEIAEIGEALNVHSYIGYNGALAIYRGETIYSEPMDPGSVQYILDTAAKYGHELVLYTDNKNYFTAMSSPKVNQFIEVFHLRQNAEYTSEVIGNILGITIISASDQDGKYYQFDDEIHLSQVNIPGMGHCFDVIRKQVNKGVGIKFLLDRLGISPKDAIAFGDGMNDKEMLSYVGEGFAMANAHENLFAYAKHRTTSVTDSGIYNGLKSLGLWN
ncbi:HAD family hydrolase [Mesobacillus foraminis]|uniref:HAD family hydrolase n=1 Tax=Mesobacillus foraminis TaxID=279826 RepID=UPI0039A173A9